MWKKGTVELTLSEMNMLATDLGEESCVPDILGESILQNSLNFCLDEEDEIFEGYGRRENVYPYRKYNTYSRELKEKTVKTAVLENKHIKATFLPELGGRLWSLIDKNTGKNLLYTNDVLQFRNLAVCNAWFSGGVEWNIGVIGHTPFTTKQLYVAVLTDEDNNPVLRMYEYERIRKVFYQMDFWLAEEDTALNCRMRIVNENEEVVPMYWWSNTAVPEFTGGRLIVPAKTAFTNSDGKVYKVDVPYVNGVDVTRYNDIPDAVDYFFDIEKDSPKFIASVDKDGYGLLQMSTSRLRSRKLFSWGHTRASHHWQELLTKDGGDYIEIRAGLAKTQYGCIPMAPHTAWEWMEQYGPVQLTQEQLTKSNQESSEWLTKKLNENNRVTGLEEMLIHTKKMAKMQAEVVQCGSGYGAFIAQKDGTKHLEFAADSEAMKKWETFLRIGVLHEPDPQSVPDMFWAEEAVYEQLQKNITEQNQNNWYAHYQLGISYYVRKEYKKAKKELKMSFELAENPWACHGLACLYLKNGRKKKAVSWILQGIGQKRNNASYLKEGFKILYLAEGYEELVRCYEELGAEEKEIRRLQFYHICAKYELGQWREALDLLEANGGFWMEDIREGENSIDQLWINLQKAAGNESKEIPYQFLYKTF